MVAYSTCKLEYIATSRAKKEATWLKNFIGDLRVFPSFQEPIEIFYDNEGAGALTKEPKDSGRSRHILTKYHYVWHSFEDGDLMVNQVSSEDNFADPFTKGLRKNKHIEHAMSIWLTIDISFSD